MSRVRSFGRFRSMTVVRWCSPPSLPSSAVAPSECSASCLRGGLPDLRACRSGLAPAERRPAASNALVSLEAMGNTLLASDSGTAAAAVTACLAVLAAEAAATAVATAKLRTADGGRAWASTEAPPSPPQTSSGWQSSSSSLAVRSVRRATESVWDLVILGCCSSSSSSTSSRKVFLTRVLISEKTLMAAKRVCAPMVSAAWQFLLEPR
mmetsp:Transcript_79631/g.237193  ORF Transcript_79631/g.237193 Transcript_79631/m.237193 type:complete len:209 (-) Transcript_79631:2-628(-)